MKSPDGLNKNCKFYENYENCEFPYPVSFKIIVKSAVPVEPSVLRDLTFRQHAKRTRNILVILLYCNC